MSIFLSGSLAYDYIMDFPDTFQRHILPDQLHILSVCFGVQKLERGWGGTAGNIAYAMGLLGSHPVVASALGTDGGAYRDRLKALGVNTDHIVQDEAIMTASAHIITDKANNQITAFFPGPLARAGEISITALPTAPSLALISPNPKEVMQDHLMQAKAKGIKTIFDPGQQMTTFDPDALRACVSASTFVIGNDYEMKLLSEYTGWSEQEVLEKVEVAITTLGEKGSIIRTKNETIHAEPCKVSACVDPTGAGDAYRAGFFVGYEQGKDLKTCAQMGSVTAAYAVEVYGTQNYSFAKEAFEKRYEETYGERS
jgi:adenosine kinase